MLGEAAQAGLRLNADGCCLLESPREPESVEVHESRTLAWRLIELLPRVTIDNSGLWPKRVAAIGQAVRHPDLLLRDGGVTVHASVGPSVKGVATENLQPVGARRGAADI